MWHWILFWRIYEQSSFCLLYYLFYTGIITSEWKFSFSKEKINNIFNKVTPDPFGLHLLLHIR